MNWLAHAFLAAPDDGAVVGTLMADFARLHDLSALPDAVARGVRQHRAVDALTDAHPTVAASRARFEPPYRRFAGIVLDVAFDHFLARHWSRFDALPLRVFSRRVYRALEDHEALLPPRLRAVLPAMAAEDWLASYADLESVDLALRGISRRMRRENPLATAIGPLRANYAAIEGDFLAFFPQLRLAIGYAAPVSC